MKELLTPKDQVIKSGKYYIYYHLDPITTIPVYVGKGKGERAWDFCLRHPEHKKWIKELQKNGLSPIVIIGNYFESEKEAYKTEREDIAAIRSLDAKMFNISPGGAGNLGELAKLFCTKPIICLTSGKRYDSTVAASEDLGIITKRINDVLKGRKKSYKGYRFRYADDTLNEEPKKLRNKKELGKKNGSRCKPIVCNETGIAYASAEEAGKGIGVSGSYIRRQIKGIIKNARGFTFREVN